MNLEKIKNLLINISQFEIIKIIDNSSSHASHKGVQGLLNDITHVEIHVKNPNNLNRLDIHRQIYNNLNSEIELGLHSIEIKILKN
jgi:stress-induced morphogen